MSRSLWRLVGYRCLVMGSIRGGGSAMLRNQDTVTSRQVGTKSEIEGCCITEVPTLEKSVILRRLLSSRMILATGYC
jgi:hypothetical protein